MEWSALQYGIFEAERTRPVRDLLAGIPRRAAGRVIDLGCGPGNSTAELAAHYPAAAIEALDTSPDMVAAARRRLPGADIRLADIATWQAPAAYDVILSNAVLHWLPDHAALLPRLVAMLAPGGSLAIQMPDNLAEPCSRLMHQPRWAGRLAAAAARRTQVGDPAFYYRVLAGSGVRAEIWRTVYHHVLDGPDAVVEWFKGSGLRPFLAALPDTDHAAYLDCYRDAIGRAYPPQPDGRLLLAFPRLFVVATRPPAPGDPAA
jgi:trans-aconitate 2-methyltransferase